MNHLALHNDLSYCSVDGRLIFLDTFNDRYFRLSEDLEAALLQHVDGHAIADDLRRRLVQREILVDAVPGNSPSIRKSVPVPTRSALELVARPQRGRSLPLAQAMWLVSVTQLQLKTIRLKRILTQLAASRARLACGARNGVENQRRVFDAASDFAHARRLVPIETCCLLDSIALVKFLSKRGIHAHIVFGVMSDPFAAHCWVQCGEDILNDTLGHATAHTPIRVI